MSSATMITRRPRHRAAETSAVFLPGARRLIGSRPALRNNRLVQPQRRAGILPREVLLTLVARLKVSLHPRLPVVEAPALLVVLLLWPERNPPASGAIVALGCGLGSVVEPPLISRSGLRSWLRRETVEGAAPVLLAAGGVVAARAESSLLLRCPTENGRASLTPDVAARLHSSCSGSEASAVARCLPDDGCSLPPIGAERLRSKSPCLLAAGVPVRARWSEALPYLPVALTGTLLFSDRS